MENGKTWLLIANASRARIYSLYKARLFQTPTSDSLNSIGEFLHPDSRKKNADLVTDKAGELSPGILAESASPKLQEAATFAIELVRQLESARNENQFKDLVVVAPAHFIGLLNNHMPKELRKLVSKEIEKDYTSYSETQMAAQLADLL